MFYEATAIFRGRSDEVLNKKTKQKNNKKTDGRQTEPVSGRGTVTKI